MIKFICLGETKNVFYLHSQISTENQKAVFVGHQKKIILSTNIAETSLTIPDVNYVIDCGKQRMKLFEPGSQISMWQDVLISRSSAKQRAGRCGRLPGTHGEAGFEIYLKNIQQNSSGIYSVSNPVSVLPSIFTANI